MELGELANETRCFKCWSKKARSSDDVFLEEFVDGVHFILSFVLVKRLCFSEKVEDTVMSETDQFNTVYEERVEFKLSPNQDNYNKLIICSLQLGRLLGFNEDAIQDAYYKKIEINYERQNEGY